MPLDPAEASEITRKVEEVAAVIEPVKAQLREMGYDPHLIADGARGIIRLTLEVHTVRRDG